MKQPLFADPVHEPAVHRAWESLVRGEGTPGAMLRSLVDHSWHRCMEVGVDPNLAQGPHPLTAEALALLHERQRDMLEASRPVMACAREFLAETGSIMILADASGTILAAEGDPGAQDAASLIHLMPGVRWSEALCGTNAIGTALAVGGPVQIHSSEHFCAGIKRWTCAATVVRHPLDGEVLGVLDISGLSPSYSRQSLALAVTTAGRIENRLKMAETERRYRLLEHAMAHWSGAGRAGAVLFDHRGVPIKINENAHHAIADAGGDPRWLDAPRLPVLPRSGGLPPWLRPEWLLPMTVGHETLGTLLLMPASRRTARLAAPAAAHPASGADALDTLVYQHPVMQQVVARARQLAPARTPVLLQGETGTGKEAFARSMHGTRQGAYVALNCGGLARELLASELFGYVEGAFTGARKGGMPGKIEAAHGGTLFLDEIGEMPLDMQPLLLRVLEQGEVWRLGENTPRRVDFRLVAATHRDLRAEVEAGRFRMDLYYRIAVASLRIPPLRERGDDVLRLARHYLAHFRREAGQPASDICPLPPDVAACLLAYAWPGNVRELRNVMEAAALVSEGRPLTPSMLPEEIQAALQPPATAAPPPGLAKPLADAPAARAAVTESTPRLQDSEAAAIQQAIDAAQGNLTQAARNLRIAKSTLYVKMQRYGLQRPGRRR